MVSAVGWFGDGGMGVEIFRGMGRVITRLLYVKLGWAASSSEEIALRDARYGPLPAVAWARYSLLMFTWSSSYWVHQ